MKKARIVIVLAIVLAFLLVGCVTTPTMISKKLTADVLMGGRYKAVGLCQDGKLLYLIYENDKSWWITEVQIEEGTRKSAEIRLILEPEDGKFYVKAKQIWYMGFDDVNGLHGMIFPIATKEVSKDEAMKWAKPRLELLNKKGGSMIEAMREAALIMGVLSSA